MNFQEIIIHLEKEGQKNIKFDKYGDITAYKDNPNGRRTHSTWRVNPRTDQLELRESKMRSIQKNR